MRKTLALLMFWGWSIGCIALIAVEPDTDDQWLKRLCEKGGGVTAADYCRARMALSASQPQALARWTMRLMECTAQAALHHARDAEQHWQAADQVVEQFRVQRAENSRLPWLEWQVARNRFLRAQDSLARWLAAPQQSATREQALQAVRIVEAKLDDLDNDLKRRLPLAADQPSGKSGEAPSEQLLQLRLDSQLLRCESLLVRARCYPAESPDRIAASTQVAATVQQALEWVPANWPSRHQLLVAWSNAKLDLGTRQVALSELKQISDDSQLDTLVRVRALVTLINALIDEQYVDAAQQYVNRLRALDNGPEAALAEIRLQTMVIDNLVGPSREEAIQAIVTGAKTIGQRHGDYWGKRADALLVESLGTQSVSGDLTLGTDIVMAEVRQLLAAQNHQAAIDKLVQATELAKAQKKLSAAIDFSKIAFALMRRNGQPGSGSRFMLSQTEEMHSEASAPSLHWLAIEVLVEEVRRHPADTEQSRSYIAALESQLALWPDAHEADSALEWLQQWHVGQQQIHKFIGSVHKRIDSARNPQNIRRSLVKLLEASILLPPDAALADAQWIGDFRSRAPQELAGAVQIFAVACEAFASWPTPTRGLELQKLNQWVESSKLDAIDDQLRRSVDLLNAARTGRFAAAQAPIQKNSPVILTRALQLAWARCMLEAIDELPPDERRRWSIVFENWPHLNQPITNLSGQPIEQAVLLRIAGMREGSALVVEPLKKLVEQFPRDGSLLLELAHLLFELGPQGRSEALQISQTVASGADKSGILFLRARWLQIRLLMAEGNQDKAREIAGHVLLTQQMPSLIWQNRFESVRQ